MEWHFGADKPTSLQRLLEKVFDTDYRDIPDGSIFIPKTAYSSRNVDFDTPAYISESTIRDAGDWTYFLELTVIKELFEGFSELDLPLLDRVTHYAIFDDFPADS